MPKKNHRGVTLPELMMVVVILAITGTLAFPQMKKLNALRQKTYAYDSLKTVGDALRKYNQDFDTDIFADIGTNADNLLAELENKNYLKRAELFRQGVGYCLGTEAVTNNRILGVGSDGDCLTRGVTFSHGFSTDKGRKNAWLTYQVCSTDTGCTSLGAKKNRINYSDHPEKF